MHILLTIHHHLDPNAGAPGVTLDLGRAYQALGHNVSFYSFDDLPAFPGLWLRPLLFPWFTAFHIVRKRPVPDTIEASTGDAWVWAALFRPFYRHPPLLVTQSHGLEHMVHEQRVTDACAGGTRLSWKYPFYHGGYRLWETAISLRKADLAIFLNRHDKEYAVKRLRVRDDRAVVFPNGIPETFHGLPLERLPDNLQPGIAVIGSHIERKGIRYSVPALVIVLRQNPQVRVGLFGTGLDRATVLKDFPADVRDRVHVTPSYDRNALPSALSGYHIVLLASLSEGFGLTLVEAMACGLAPVATNIQGPADIICDGANGILVPPRNSKAIVSVLQKLLDTRSTLESLRKRAREKAREYDWNRIAQQRLALYAGFRRCEKHGCG